MQTETNQGGAQPPTKEKPTNTDSHHDELSHRRGSGVMAAPNAPVPPTTLAEGARGPFNSFWTSQAPSGWDVDERFPIQVHTLPFATLLAEGVTPIHLGEFAVTSGVIATADALDDPETVVTPIPAGTYTMTGFLDPDGRLAAVAIQRDPRRRDPRFWRLAERDATDPRFRWEVPIDSGHMLLCDAAHRNTLRPRLRESMCAMVDDPLSLGGDRPYVDLREVFGVPGWVLRTGYGDGGHPTYLGVDEDGTVRTVILDFRIWT